MLGSANCLHASSVTFNCVTVATLTSGVWTSFACRFDWRVPPASSWLSWYLFATTLARTASVEVLLHRIFRHSCNGTITIAVSGCVKIRDTGEGMRKLSLLTKTSDCPPDAPGTSVKTAASLSGMTSKSSASEVHPCRDTGWSRLPSSRHSATEVSGSLHFLSSQQSGQHVAPFRAEPHRRASFDALTRVAIKLPCASEQPNVSLFLRMQDFETYFFMLPIIGFNANFLPFLGTLVGLVNAPGCHCSLVVHL